MDYARIQNDEAKFENMIACELWRAATLWTDLGFGDFSLHFIKDKEKREVDFLVVKDGKPLVLVEAKLSDTQPARSLAVFQDILQIPAVQLNNEGEGYRVIQNGSKNILIAPAWQWLAGLP
ncbi:hypothetical protein PITCH_A420001 [uncultured Desulfobacterium sp.]|uniref:Uncharacterized protein n=1 Tax=uncultured Desulfobacterium sp. TaxID=201089 RepID=A0A445N0B5_9BACT|nr:hypothetical protein PITCH_A420001 [uncultured Desulfobacterium sp.]